MSISQNHTTQKFRLFLYSFLILFLELALIRFIPANIKLIGYFANIILLATFLGMGCGMLLTKRGYPLDVFFPYIITLLCTIIAVFHLNITIASPDAIFFSAVDQKITGLEPNIILPIIFLLVALTNIPLAQALGVLFSKLSPLEAYASDIGGSLAGIALFTALSFCSVPPVVWFMIIFGIYGLLQFRKSTGYALSMVACVACLVVVASIDKGSLWSPYYKITVTTQTDGISFDPKIAIAVNNIPHQYISRYGLREPFYYLPYQLFRGKPFKKILIIGAGTGADTATALALQPTVEHIDAVEIDPTIAALGKRLNPDKPFDNPKVAFHIDDGRSFLQNSKDRYDLIIYALTDSLALAAKSANIRLESFIFTTESFQLVKNHLTEHGLFTLYNYYRENWLIDKLAGMTTQVFGYPPVVFPYGEESKAAVILTGPKIHELQGGLVKTYEPKEHIPPASDNWPFLYLKHPAIPPLYSSFIGLLAVLSVALVRLVHGRSKQLKFDFRFFCFGAGFLLLETKSLATFALLFGTTWLVNSLVFASLLLFVLLAIWINERYRIRRILLWYIGLFVMLSVQLVVPMDWFIILPFWVRLLAASVFFVSPVFFANVLFAQLFKTSEHPEHAFAINLLGALTGGFLEYISLAFGYQTLIGLIILCYAIALIHPMLPEIEIQK